MLCDTGGETGPQRVAGEAGTMEVVYRGGVVPLFPKRFQRGSCRFLSKVRGNNFCIWKEVLLVAADL